MSIASLIKAVVTGDTQSIVETMKQEERDAGRIIYVPITHPRVPGLGETLPWFLYGFHGFDWSYDSFMAGEKGKKTLRVVLLNARKPNTGAFRKLHKEATGHGYQLEIIEPTREFAAILRRYGYVEKITHDADYRIIEKSYIMLT